MRWVSFDPARGYRQKRPPIYKNVLVLLAENHEKGLPQGVAVGYRKDSGGDKSLPFFVVPGIGGTVIAWSDSLPDDFVAPARFPSQNNSSQTAGSQTATDSVTNK
jgi:hypothetical protein